MIMKNSIILILAVFFAFSCNQNTEQTTVNEETETLIPDKVKDGVFIHISEGENDPHKVLMPLKMALLMSEDKDVLVYMDIKAAELCVNEAEDIEHPEFDSFKSYIKQLKEAGVGLYVCPSCLKIAGLNPEDLIEGIDIASKDRFFDFTEGRILSLDY